MYLNHAQMFHARSSDFSLLSVINVRLSTFSTNSQFPLTSKYKWCLELWVERL